MSGHYGMRDSRYNDERPCQEALDRSAAEWEVQVLCDLHRQKFKKRWKLVFGHYEYGGDALLLPTAVMDWAGLDADNPKLSRTKTASSLNDSGKSFNYIADRIEKYL